MENNNGKVKYKILWDRVIIALVILAVIIAGLIMLISCLVSAIKNAFSDDDSSSALKADVSVSDTSKTEVSSTSSEDSNVVINKIKIVIDAGHGGNDAGAVAPSSTRYEKDDDLKIAKYVEQYLLQHEDIEVIMTRSDDTFVSLNDRCSIANDAQADLFVSLHRNLYDGNAQGVEIWVNKKQPVVDIALAQNIMDGLESVGISNNRGVCFGFIGNPNVNYQVNRETDMPSCLVEMGFMQDDEDNELFDKNCEAYGKAIADAIYKTAMEAGLVEGVSRTLPEDPLDANTGEPEQIPVET